MRRSRLMTESCCFSPRWNKWFWSDYQYTFLNFAWNSPDSATTFRCCSPCFWEKLGVYFVLEVQKWILLEYEVCTPVVRGVFVWVGWLLSLELVWNLPSVSLRTAMLQWRSPPEVPMKGSNINAKVLTTGPSAILVCPSTFCSSAHPDALRVHLVLQFLNHERACNQPAPAPQHVVPNVVAGDLEWLEKKAIQQERPTHLSFGDQMIR
jgi:hypothetical protein